ncbi:hypothetical protein AB0M83_16485 [Amycolatopsis sp. NPDC051106]|uniref:hypothetical protein n=1 Tax=unclassified Amycolatopsis TaxID=2618356 RepID=UPI00344358BF
MITFGGGAVLAVAMSVTTSKPAWALSRLGLLALGAVVVVTQAIGFSTQYRRRKLPAGDSRSPARSTSPRRPGRTR